jgi:hypothetical protein
VRFLRILGIFGEFLMMGNLLRVSGLRGKVYFSSEEKYTF